MAHLNGIPIVRTSSCYLFQQRSLRFISSLFHSNNVLVGLYKKISNRKKDVKLKFTSTTG